MALALPCVPCCSIPLPPTRRPSVKAAAISSKVPDSTTTHLGTSTAVLFCRVHLPLLVARSQRSAQALQFVLVTEHLFALDMCKWAIAMKYTVASNQGEASKHSRAAWLSNHATITRHVPQGGKFLLYAVVWVLLAGFRRRLSRQTWKH
jgi:hypothetical protein